MRASNARPGGADKMDVLQRSGSSVRIRFLQNGPCLDASAQRPTFWQSRTCGNFSAKSKKSQHFLIHRLVTIHAMPKHIPVTGATDPRSQRTRIRNPEQRAAHRQFVFVARRVNHHHPGRQQTGRSRKMRLCPSPYNRPPGRAQRQHKIDRWRTEKDSAKLFPGNEATRIIGGESFVYPQRYQVPTSNGQGASFDARPGDHLPNELAQ